MAQFKFWIWTNLFESDTYSYSADWYSSIPFIMLETEAKKLLIPVKLIKELIAHGATKPIYLGTWS